MQVSTSSSFSSPVVDDTSITAVGSTHLQVHLSLATAYYWRVRAVDINSSNYDVSDWSAVWSFHMPWQLNAASSQGGGIHGKLVWFCVQR